ncbi:hypothetical protein HAPAU_28450 [Halalkalicoccus paucihalophilus]|uniref:Macroglobulin domain-containing protein n=1 Tax=Halalkalicoccus paucihalophilus TaxID=1008153 RepID=A0A151ABQ5_9EURY|nr:hypothetical protein [Halalkalicoccus paucihalophilus]KYH25024.1 hypothetical protein HAPAU_28450 [Halalkalicoccus paucihalophilus]
MITTQRTLLTLLVCISVVLAGCAGFGTDSPAGNNDGNQSPDESSDLEDEQDNADSTDETSNTSDSSSDGTDESTNRSSSNGSDTTSESSTESDSDTSTSSDTGSDGDSDSGSSSDSDRDDDSDTDDSDSDSDSEPSDDSDSNDDPADEEESESQPPSYTHTVTVEVTNESGDPVADELVTAEVEDETIEYRTGDDGTVTLDYESPDEGAVEFAITVGDETRTVQVTQDDQTESFVVSSTDGDNSSDENDSESHSFRVDVNEDVPVTVENDETGETWTKEATDGSAMFDLPEGLYHVEAEDHTSTMVMIDVPATDSIHLQSGYDSFTINVIDAETGGPIEDAEVSGVCDWWHSSGDAYITGESNADGVIETSVISPSSCHGVHVEADGYETTTISDISIPDDDGMTVELESAEQEQEEETNETLVV